MFRLRFITLTVLALTVSIMSMPAVSQTPATGAPPSLKSTPEVQALNAAGNQALSAAPPKLEEAERLYNQALEQARKLQDKAGVAKSLRNLGNVFVTRKQTDRALNYYQQSLAACREIHDTIGEGDTFYNIALLYTQTQPGKVEETFRQARARYHEAGDFNSEARAMTTNGNFHQTRGEIRQAKEAFTEAIQFAHTTGSEKAEADALWYRANLSSFAKDANADRPTLDEAREDFLKAIVLYHKANDLADEAWTDTLLGDIYFFQGYVDEYRKYYEKALALYRTVKDNKHITDTLSNLGNITGSQDRLVESLQYEQEALDLYRKTNDVSGEGTTLLHIGDLYTRIGQQRTALQHYLLALPLVQKAGDTDKQTTALQNIAVVYQILGDNETAKKYYSQLLPLLDKPGNELSRLRNLGIKANIYYQTGNYQKQRDTLEQELAEERKGGWTPLMSSTMSMLGEAESKLGHTDRALEFYQEVLRLTKEESDNLSTASILNSIAELQEKKGNLAAAEENLRAAITILENVRASLSGLSQAKTSFLDKSLLTYRQYLALLIRRNKPKEGFALAQKMKARALLDILYAGKVQLAGSLTPDEREQEKSLRQKSDALNYQLVKEGVQNEIGSRKRAEAIKLQIAEAERELQIYEDSLYTRHPDLAEKRAAKTITVGDVAKFLPEDTALLEYVLLKVGNTDEIVLFVVTNKAGAPILSTHILPVSHEVLKKQVDALRDACTDPRKPYRVAAQALYQTLVAPAQTRLAGKKRLLVCPDGLLWDVPFAALLADSHSGARSAPQAAKFLIQQFEIAYAYSATGAQAELMAQNGGKRRPVTKTILAFANPDFGGELRFGDHLPGERPIPSASRPISSASRPIASASRPISSASRPIASASRDPLQLFRGGYLSPLPGTQREAEAIKADFKDAVIYTNQAAQEKSVKQEADKYRYLHFATHGFFNDTAPLLSAIILAQPNQKSGDDGFLTAREIFDLNLSADMVVLSACNTARGEKRNGEGLIGLTWALFAAGAPTQVVSQWSVNDASTALLMQNFYSNLTREHMAKGMALRQAALSLLNDNPKNQTAKQKYAHPYYWAPFILIGNWGK